MTVMATAGNRWAVVMSRGAGFTNQVFFCFLYIHSYVCVEFDYLAGLMF